MRIKRILIMVTVIVFFCYEEALAANYINVGYGASIDMDSVKSNFGEYRAIVKVKPDRETRKEIYDKIGKRIDSMMYLYAFKKNKPELRAISLTMMFRDGSTRFFKIGDSWETCVGPGYTWWKKIMEHKGKKLKRRE